MDQRIIYNEIGICIINTDRATCLFRLLTSIAKYTDFRILQEAKVNILDDSLNSASVVQTIKQFPFVNYIHTGVRIGVAHNTNRALQLIKHKQFSFIFNNDCEILKEKWIDFYFNASIQTNIHHFSFQQEGIWGAGTDKRPEEKKIINGVEIKTLQNYPQGALLVFDKLAFKTVGYFDSIAFMGYGKSHWDWSFRISESGIQPKGFHDVISSNNYFKVHDERCITDPKKRAEDYRRNTEIYNQRIKDIQSKKRPIFVEYPNG